MAEPLAEALQTKMPVVPKGQRMTGEQISSSLTQFQPQKAQFEKDIAAATGEEAMAKQKQAEIKSAGMMGAEEAYGKAERGATQQFEERKRAEPLPAFVPTQDNAQDMAGLFSLINVIGMVVGGGGKHNAQLAMNAMNGMLEGYQKGRGDLYKRERDTFEKNFKTMIQKHKEFREDMEDAIRLAATDKRAGVAAAEEAAVKAGSDIVKAQIRKGDLLGAYNNLKETEKSANKALEMYNANINAERQEMLAENRHQQSMALRERANELAERRLALQEDKLRKGEGGKPLKETEVAKIEGLQSLSKDLQKLKKEFKDEYASLGLLGLGADLSYEAKRRLGDEEGRKAVQWWSKYERLQAPNRHALFGATLTGNELKNYLSFTAKKSDNPQVVRDMLQDQSDYVRGTAENRALSYESAGYKVPDRQPRSFTDTYSGSTQAAPAQRPVPTEADRERGRSNPTSRENFIRHFGEEP